MQTTLEIEFPLRLGVKNTLRLCVKQNVLAYCLVQIINQIFHILNSNTEPDKSI